eukprot:jgi/Mesvir1/10379/Mv10579-RA.1
MNDINKESMVGILPSLALVSGVVGIGGASAGLFFDGRSRDAPRILRELELRERREGTTPRSQMERDESIRSEQEEFERKRALSSTVAIAGLSLCAVTGYLYWYQKHGPRAPA